MKCRYCNAEYQGEYCPDCGTPAGMDRPSHQQEPVSSVFSETPQKQPVFVHSPANIRQPRRSPLLLLSLIVGAIVIIAFVAASFLGLVKYNADSSVTTYSIMVSKDLQAAVQQEPPQSKEIIQPNQYSEVAYHADEFQGSQLSCWAQVLYNAQQTEEGSYFSFRTVSAENSGQEIYGIGFWPDVSTELYDGCYLSITGTVLGEYSYTDSFGYEDKGPAFYITQLSSSSYAEIFAPAIVTLSPDLSPVTRNGCSISLNRVEFAETETRFYLIIQNNTDEHLILYPDETTVYQENRRYHWQENYQADYTLLYDGVGAGETRELILAFPPMSDCWNMELSVEVDNLSSQPFTFHVPGNEESCLTPVLGLPSQTPVPSESALTEDSSSP